MRIKYFQSIIIFWVHLAKEIPSFFIFSFFDSWHAWFELLDMSVHLFFWFFLSLFVLNWKGTLCWITDSCFWLNFRFAFDIDLDAPKVRVPLRISGSDRCGSHFVLDFGHFTLHTAVSYLKYKILVWSFYTVHPAYDLTWHILYWFLFSQESQSDEKRQNLYSRFYISGRDIAAFFTDCGSEFGSCSMVKPMYESQVLNSPIGKKDENVYYLIDRCGMAVLVNQVCFLNAYIWMAFGCAWLVHILFLSLVILD